jgi:hypothetical protein
MRKSTCSGKREDTAQHGHPCVPMAGERTLRSEVGLAPDVDAREPLTCNKRAWQQSGHATPCF